MGAEERETSRAEAVSCFSTALDASNVRSSESSNAFGWVGGSPLLLRPSAPLLLCCPQDLRSTRLTAPTAPASSVHEAPC
jgi:hypothetical protein